GIHNPAVAAPPGGPPEPDGAREEPSRTEVLRKVRVCENPRGPAVLRRRHGRLFDVEKSVNLGKRSGRAATSNRHASTCQYVPDEPPDYVGTGRRGPGAVGSSGSLHRRFLEQKGPGEVEPGGNRPADHEIALGEGSDGAVCAGQRRRGLWERFAERGRVPGRPGRWNAAHRDRRHWNRGTRAWHGRRGRPRARRSRERRQTV